MQSHYFISKSNFNFTESTNVSVWTNSGKQTRVSIARELSSAAFQMSPDNCDLIVEIA